MKIIDTIKERVENLLTAPGKELGRWSRFVRFQIQLWRFCARQLRKHNAMAMSSALSFRTIFALVPTLVLALLTVKAIMPQEDSRALLHKGMAAANLTEIVIIQDPCALGRSEAGVQSEQKKSVNAADEIEKLVTKVEQKLTLKRIGPVGTVLLIWTALTLLTTMERSLNRIYGASQSRPLARRVMLYWSVLTLGPIVLVATSYLGARAMHSSQNIPVLSGFMSLIGWLEPVLVGIILLGALYKLMPNTKVSFNSAVGGALVAVPLWLVAKWAFTLYVHEVVGKGSLYGALGLIPIFLIWLNLSWTIFLFGAELSHTAANLSRMQAAEQAARITVGPSDILAAALAVARGYQAGSGSVSFEQVASQLNLPDELVQNLLERLTTNNILYPIESEGDNTYVLARPAEKISVLEVMEIDDTARTSRLGVYTDQISQDVNQVKNRSRTAMGGYNLADVLNNNDK